MYNKGYTNCSACRLNVLRKPRSFNYKKSNNPQIDDNADDLEDIRRLAVIQGRLSFSSPPQSRGRHLNNNRNGNRHHENTRTTGTATGHVWRGCLDSHPRGNSNPNHQQNMNHHANTNRFNHPRAVIVAIDRHATIIL